MLAEKIPGCGVVDGSNELPFGGGSCEQERHQGGVPEPSAEPGRQTRPTWNQILNYGIMNSWCSCCAAGTRVIGAKTLSLFSVLSVPRESPRDARDEINYYSPTFIQVWLR